MWQVSKGLLLVVMAPILLMSIVFLSAGFLASPEALGDDSSPLKNQHYLVGASFVLFHSTTLTILLVLVHFASSFSMSE